MLEEETIRAVRREQIKWKPQPALLEGAMHAEIVGDTLEAGPYIFRLRVPPGVRVMPHFHPDDRIYTVLSGTFCIGSGESFKDNLLEKYGTGDVVFVPANLDHFQFSEEGYTLQVEGNGPSAFVYTNREDDPR